MWYFPARCCSQIASRFDNAATDLVVRPATYNRKFHVSEVAALRAALILDFIFRLSCFACTLHERDRVRN